MTDHRQILAPHDEIAELRQLARDLVRPLARIIGAMEVSHCDADDASETIDKWQAYNERTNGR